MSRRRRRRREASVRAGAAPTAAGRGRLAIIDGLRGFGICLMVVYHFVFDLAWFRVIRADFNTDPFWLGFRAVIVTLFLGLVGVSLVLAKRAHPGWPPFWRRIALIVFSAALVSIGSYLTFPQTFIRFGILHFIAVASVLARPLVALPRVALVAGIAVLALGATVQLPLFDAPWLNWVGMMTHKPQTEDYVPVVPWLGVVLIGVALGALVPQAQRPLDAASRSTPSWLAWVGRHSLIIYLVHQPILIGILRVVL
ncbi:MAG TPA: heparan-alpha-glucosaminide N-acetyltransferase [Casimicrobiaceae bacterium]